MIANGIFAIIDEEEHRPHLVDPMSEELRAATAADRDYLALIKTVESGVPSNSEKLDPSVRPFWKIRNDLWTDGGLVLFGTRIIVPKSKRPEILSKLHAAHQGIWE